MLENRREIVWTVSRLANECKLLAIMHCMIRFLMFYRRSQAKYDLENTFLSCPFLSFLLILLHFHPFNWIFQMETKASFTNRELRNNTFVQLKIHFPMLMNFLTTEKYFDQISSCSRTNALCVPNGNQISWSKDVWQKWEQKLSSLIAKASQHKLSHSMRTK